MSALNGMGSIPPHELSRRFGAPGAGRWLWAQCSEWSLHLLSPAEADIARGGQQARAACGRAIPADPTFRNGRPSEMCDQCATFGASRSVIGDR